MNKNPVQARLARQRKRQRGDLQALMLEVWVAVEKAVETLDLAVSGPERCAAIHAMSSIAGVYTKMIQVSEHEARLALVYKILEELVHAAQ
jgi:hypothetical protein